MAAAAVVVVVDDDGDDAAWRPTEGEVYEEAGNQAHGQSPGLTGGRRRQIPA